MYSLSSINGLIHNYSILMWQFLRDFLGFSSKQVPGNSVSNFLSEKIACNMLLTL